MVNGHHGCQGHGCHDSHGAHVLMKHDARCDHGDHGSHGCCVGHGGCGGHLNLTFQVTCHLFSSIGCAISGVSVCFNGVLDYVVSQGHIQGNSFQARPRRHRGIPKLEFISSNVLP